ncbi:YopX protein [Helicobacter cinaedi]|uniref:YopX protein n=2 Tax=Helicobacter cinaedi TaxID=213 RepID=A0A377JTC6_9HELI|nr:YopX protein [Helicobacter cinaedi]
MCPNDIEIDLWSGFIDIDGKKIYERDIIDSDFSIYGLVFYEKGRFLVKHDLLDDVESLDRVIKYTTEVELAVVDNIHEKKLQTMS